MAQKKRDSWGWHLGISVRRHHLPDLELANNFYTKIMEEAR